MSKYVKDNYEEGKADLFSVFMQMGMERLVDGGKMAQINMQSWMFLSSFEKLRKQFLTHYNIDNMLHLGPRTFDELSGEVVQNTAFVLSKHEPTEQGGTYYRLVEGKNCADKEHLFLLHINDNEDGNRIYYPNVEQKNFEKIPGCPIGYWVSEKMIEAFDHKTFISDLAISNGQNITGDNKRFIRLFWEVNNININKDYWAFCARGGGFRRYYGNVDNVILWTKAAKEHYRKDSIARIIPEELQFKNGVTWSYICSGNPSFRKLHDTETFEKAGTSIFVTNIKQTESIVAFLNSVVAKYMFKIIAPTLNYQVRDIFSLPIIKEIFTKSIIHLYDNSYIISKQDWDAHETSWDFQRNELLSIDTDTYMENIDYKIEKHFEETGEHICIDPAAPKLGSLKWRMEQYKTKWERKFMQLHKNEEELNRQFIDIYGLQDELTPDVPLNEITILQQGEISIE